MKCKLELTMREVDSQTTACQWKCEICGRKSAVLYDKRDIWEAKEQCPPCPGNPTTDIEIETILPTPTDIEIVDA